MNKLSGWDDTIVALATPPGIGAIGVLRLSGAKAIEIANKLIPSKDLQHQHSHTLHVGVLKDGDNLLDEVVVSLFKNPTSYTGEDIVEISCHGSPFIQQQVIEACIKYGARLAKPGEFTQRAFLNGKIDLTQAEAVADIISSNTAASQKAALHTMRGGFSMNLKELRERLLKFSALIELELDFSQEDVEFADRRQFYGLINELQESTDKLINSFRLGNVIRNGVSVAIVGKPNAGKSTLLNRLLNENRAIVSDIPGTTRDTIEEVINIDGILFRLIDTAGIRQHTTDTIETAGIERSLEKMREADIVLYLFDVRNDKLEEVQEWCMEAKKLDIKYLLVANKADELEEAKARQELSALEHVIFISAKQNLHIEVLREKMVDTVIQGQVQPESTIITNARHYHALKEVSSSLSEIKRGLDDKLPGDLLALDIRRCLHYLGEITGEITTEDQLDYIFSKFC
ncbi:MAG TPA: tRNA uridine-5-carboxymethylaminomethyl(34) synthesis GTPase MnmE, partial [Chitinophagaceae bacterium]|nr:tRNA uridine-5-carboxymethylaminomethyl(34) synthesis GTPase MnmE [Chitinophagaceae bacterium]